MCGLWSTSVRVFIWWVLFLFKEYGRRKFDQYQPSIFPCEKPCTHCGRCRYQRKVASEYHPFPNDYGGSRDDYYDHYHPWNEDDCPHINITKTSSPSTTSSGTTTPETSSSTSQPVKLLKVELNSAMYELLRIEPSETRFKQLLRLYDRNAEHA